MPVYEYWCPTCNEDYEIYKPIDKYNTTESCLKGHILHKKVSTISLGYVNQYKDIERKAVLEGNVIHEPGLNKDAQRNREYQKEEMKNNIRKSIVNTISGFDV